MNEYGAVAYIYDLLNAQLDYVKWADFIEECFTRFMPEKPSLVLDLACGTGSMTKELARRGYDMTGADLSADMLTVARERAEADGVADRIMYLRQDMRSFELYGTVGAVVCCLDSINYLQSAADVRRCFSLVHNYTDNGGLFIFDINTPYKFENVYADNSYILESERDGAAVFCAWQNYYDRKTKKCDFYLTLFEENSASGRYIRQDETQRERCYEPNELLAILKECGFEQVGMFGDTSFSAPRDTDERLHICARVIK